MLFAIAKFESNKIMPIIKQIVDDSNCFLYPETNYKIVKYLDLTKFISLLQQKKLFFCRLDKLEDRFEGIPGKATFENIVKRSIYKRDVDKFYKKELTDEQIRQREEGLIKWNEKVLKSNFCVNCWNKFDYESAALWKIYSDFKQGIMIKSSISNLVSSFEKSNEIIDLSEVSYNDHNRDIDESPIVTSSIIRKHMAYSYERELRLIYKVSTNYDYDWTKEKVEEGIYIEADLNILVDEIIMSPYSPKWFIELVENLSIKYGLIKKINKSEFSI